MAVSVRRLQLWSHSSPPLLPDFIDVNQASFHTSPKKINILQNYSDTHFINV